MFGRGRRTTIVASQTGPTDRGWPSRGRAPRASSLQSLRLPLRAGTGASAASMRSTSARFKFCLSCTWPLVSGELLGIELERSGLLAVRFPIPILTDFERGLLLVSCARFASIHSGFFYHATLRWIAQYVVRCACALSSTKIDTLRRTVAALLFGRSFSRTLF